MKQLKVYRAWPASTIAPRKALDLLDEPAHRRQAEMIVAAPSKAAAARILTEAIGDAVAAHVMEETQGNDVVGLQAGGRLIESGEVYVLPLNGGGDQLVAEAIAGGGWRLAGRLKRNSWRDPYTFVPEES